MLVSHSWIGEKGVYLCLFSPERLNFMKARGRPGPPTSWRASMAIAAQRRRNAHPAVTTCREKIAWTVLVVLVMAILGRRALTASAGSELGYGIREHRL
jgi:hypothetical protein